MFAMSTPHSHEPAEPSTPVDFWERRYAERPQIWSGRANHMLVDLAADLAPGRALDVGCGEGGDALWLAERGWQVTAVDIATTALARGRAAAAAAGIPEDRIDWRATDLAAWRPTDSYDLVCAFFLQSPVALDRAAILRTAATAVAPGGLLLLVSHAAPPPWSKHLQAHAHEMPQPADELAALDLDPGLWQILIAEVRQRPATGPDGQDAVLDDTVILARRA